MVYGRIFLISISLMFLSFGQQAFAKKIYAHGYLAIEGEKGDFFFPQRRDERFNAYKKKVVSVWPFDSTKFDHFSRQLPGGFLGVFAEAPSTDSFFDLFRSLTGYDLKNKVTILGYHTYKDHYYILHVKLNIHQVNFVRRIKELGREVEDAIGDGRFINHAALKSLGIKNDKLILSGPSTSVFMWSPQEALRQLAPLSSSVRNRSNCFELFFQQQVDNRDSRLGVETYDESSVQHELDQGKIEEEEILYAMVLQMVQRKKREQKI